jgi:hypothetical protein
MSYPSHIASPYLIQLAANTAANELANKFILNQARLTKIEMICVGYCSSDNALHVFSHQRILSLMINDLPNVSHTNLPHLALER